MARLSRRSLGLVLIFATAGIWIVTSIVSASLVTPGSSGTAAVHPFLLTYLATSLFTLYLPLLHFQAWWTEERHAANRPAAGAQDSVCEPNRSPSKVGRASSNEITKRGSSSIAVVAAAWATPIWFLAQFTFNLSLARTSVTSNTIISSTSSLFTFFLSILLLSEKFTATKLAAIIACIAGTALVTLSDNESASSSSSPSSQPSGSVLGDMLAVLSAALYGAYTVVMRLKMPGEEAEAHVALFFGYVGLFSTVVLAPLVVLLLSMGVFSLSSIPKEAYVLIVLEGLLDYVLSDYLWARAVMLLGPTIATLGLSVQIPMAAGADLVMGHAPWMRSAKTVLMTLGGTALILSGFFSINLSPTPPAPPGDRASSSSVQQAGSSKSKSSDDEDDELPEETTGLLEGNRAHPAAAAAGRGGLKDEELGALSGDGKDNKRG